MSVILGSWNSEASVLVSRQHKQTRRSTFSLQNHHNCTFLNLCLQTETDKSCNTHLIFSYWSDSLGLEATCWTCSASKQFVELGATRADGCRKTEYGCFNTPLMGNECTGLVWLISLFFFLWYLFVDANFLPLIWRCPGAEVWSSFMAASVKEHAAARGSLMEVRRTFCRRSSWSSAPVPPLDFVMRRLWCCCNQRQRCARGSMATHHFLHRSQNAAPRGPSYLAGAALT